MTKRLGATFGACLLVLAACASHPPAAPDLPPPPAAGLPAADPVVDEAWISPPLEGEELDSLAAWQDEDGRVLVVATAKSSHRLSVFDAASGARLRTVGGPGQGPGQFARPNGIAVFGDLLFVVERDNHRVQVLSLPAFEPLGSFGQEQLRLPYGLWVYEHAPGEVTVLVTDSFMQDFANAVPPPREQLAERVKRFRVAVDEDGVLRARYDGAFGDTGEGALFMVESIAGDPAGGRLLIAEEDRRVGSTLREYALDGRYLGRSLPPLRGEAEGVALWECEGGEGYWIAVEQLRPTRFHVLERDTLRSAGVFTGSRTARTDGIAVFAGPTPRFPGGILFALHDDRAVAAFDLGEVARSLRLSPRCGG